MNIIASFILVIAIVQGPFQCNGPRVTDMCVVPAVRMANPAICVVESSTYYRVGGAEQVATDQYKCHFAIPQPIPQDLQSEYNQPKTF